MKEIFEVKVQIVDRGITFPLQSTIEVHKPINENVQKFLNDNAHAMDLSPMFEFQILRQKSVGFGTV